jgi:OmpA-OmpF porin, OOP family
MTRQKTSSTVALFTLALLCGCANTSKNQDALSNGRSQSDVAIQADHDGYKAQQNNIEAMNNSGKHPVKSYSMAKAQRWLDVSYHEYSRNDRSRFPQLAIDESNKITRYLASSDKIESADNPALQTPLINNAAKLREDLWAQIGTLRRSPGLRCAEQNLAAGEVELVHAGNEYKQQGWRHANPYIQMAEDFITQATIDAAKCSSTAAQ